MYEDTGGTPPKDSLISESATGCTKIELAKWSTRSTKPMSIQFLSRTGIEGPLLLAPFHPLLCLTQVHRNRRSQGRRRACRNSCPHSRSISPLAGQSLRHVHLLRPPRPFPGCHCRRSDTTDSPFVLQPAGVARGQGSVQFLLLSNLSTNLLHCARMDNAEKLLVVTLGQEQVSDFTGETFRHRNRTNKRNRC